MSSWHAAVAICLALMMGRGATLAPRSLLHETSRACGHLQRRIATRGRRRPLGLKSSSIGTATSSHQPAVTTPSDHGNPKTKVYAPEQPGVGRVTNIIAVSSCKGGVGKSTTAVNLAFALKARGHEVGILDADVYGPSLPTMVTAVGPRGEVAFTAEGALVPLEAFGVKLMSLGYLSQSTAAMRGPMVMQVLQQLVGSTVWGPLDYLVLDMPPGTGDAQLTLTQALNITAAVVVTTPQRLSFVDVVKGIDLFDKVNVPSVAVVENMATFDAGPALRPGDDESWAVLEGAFERVLHMKKHDLRNALEHLGDADNGVDVLVDDSDVDHDRPFEDTSLGITSDQHLKLQARVLARVARERASTSGPNDEHLIFGRGHAVRLKDMWGIETVVQLPLDPVAAAHGDGGVPLVVADPGHPLSQKFAELADAVAREVALLRSLSSRGYIHPEVRFDAASRQLLVDEGSAETFETVDARELRLKCRCAQCVEELTGRALLDPAIIPANIAPTDFGPVGNYALQVTWTDGHKSLYPYSAFLKSRSRKEPARLAQAL